MKKFGKSQLKGLLFLAPSLAGVSLFVFLPFLDVIRRSFGEAVTGKFVGIRNYLDVFENTAFQLAAWNTLRFVGVCIPLLLVLSLAAALLLSGKIRGAGLDVYEEEGEYFYEDKSDKIIDDDVLARLLSFNNVIVTSHQAFFTKEALHNIAETTLQNIEDFRCHRPLVNEVIL